MTPTYIHCDYSLLTINFRWQGALNFELQRELVRGIPNPASITERYTWIGFSTWSNLQ